MAPNGHIALQALKKYPQIKAIVLDMMMPIMNGPNFIKYSRQLGFTDIPIVVLTGMNDFSLPERMERLKKAGVRKVLTKPVDLHLLNTTLHDALAVGE